MTNTDDMGWQSTHDLIQLLVAWCFAQWQVVTHQLSVYAGNGLGKGPYYCHSAYQVHQANVGPVFDPCDGFDMPPITSQREHKLK
jgi:hypothetical protein